MLTQRIRSVGAVLLGAGLLAILIPLAQFLTLGLNNSDLETASPVGWAVGLLVSLVLVVAICRAISRYRLIGKQSLVIVYCMLTIGVPMMNMGLVRCLFVAIQAVQNHYVARAVNTYRTAYEAESPRWFPVVPTPDGLAWNKADRLLRLLADSDAINRRKAALREASLRIALVAKRLRNASDADTTVESITNSAPQVRDAIAKLGPDETAGLMRQAVADGGEPTAFGRGLATLGLLDALKERTAETQRASGDAAAFLMTALADVDEHEVCYIPAIIAARSLNERTRFERDHERMSAEARQRLDERLAALQPRFAALRAAVTRLSEPDFARVRSHRQAQYRATFATYGEAELATIRTSFIYRSSGQERKAIYAQDGRHGTPNQNVASFTEGLTHGDSVGAGSALPLSQRLGAVARELPWHVWVPAAAHWGGLITCIFLFLMCVAEWLRRKWVDRENLAFPLVEIADNIIRHDYALESAEDITAPQVRTAMFNRVFWVGIAIGALLLTLEALGHYGITAERRMLVFPVSERLFTSGFLRQVDKVCFVLSPIVVGILFLVSLEVSLSIWVMFVAYRFVVAVVKIGAPNLVDSIYTGWGGGRAFPFEGEQLLGASLCLALVSLFKTWHTMRRGKTSDHSAPVTPYIPARLTTLGLIVMPLGIGWLLWDLGIHNIPIMVLTGAVAILLAIAHARIRAETGLPVQHATYEFTKLPLVFGLTGYLGARIYALFISLAFLPVTLLFRSLPQQLENIELARRNRVRYSTVAAASLVAFIIAIVVGSASFLTLAYFKGQAAFGGGDSSGNSYTAIFAYPLWVSHFLGESGLETFTQPHSIRIAFIIVGAGIVGALIYLRQRFMKFPINPVAYVLILLSTYFVWIIPYFKSPTTAGAEVETSWIWGSAFVAWLTKKLVIKYGGMNAYRRSKPLFVGLAVGAICSIFAWNVFDLAVSLHNEQLPPGVETSDTMKKFIENTPFNPWAY